MWTTLTSTSLTLLLPLSTFTANIYTGKTGPSSNALLDLDTVGKVYGFVRLPRACALESLSMILGMSAVGKTLALPLSSGMIGKRPNAAQGMIEGSLTRSSGEA